MNFDGACVYNVDLVANIIYVHSFYIKLFKNPPNKNYLNVPKKNNYLKII